MDENVFAPGSAGNGRRPSVSADPFEWSDRSFNDVIALLGRTWELLIGNIGTLGLGIAVLFGLQVVAQVLNFAFSFGAGMVDDEMTAALVNLSAQIPTLFFSLVQLYFQLGLIKMTIELDRGEDVELDALWSQGAAFIGVLLASLVVGIGAAVVYGFSFAVVGGMAWGAGMAMGWDIALWIGLGLGGLVFSVLLIGTLVVGLGLQLYLHAIVDGRAGSIDSLPFSWNLTDGWKLFLFIQSIVNFLLVMVVLCVTFCIASPVLTGFLLLLGAVTYNAILHDADATGRLAR